MSRSVGIVDVELDGVGWGPGRHGRLLSLLMGNVVDAVVAQAATSSRSGSGLSSEVPGAASRSRCGQDPVEPAREPPVGPAEEAHGRRHQDHADEGGVDEHGDGEADTEQLAVRVVAEDEGAEHADHDQRRRGDHPGGARQAPDDGFVVVAGRHVLLTDPGQEEHLVVHREPEEDGEHDEREERVDRHRAVQPDQLGAPAPLEHRDEHAVGGGDRQQVHERGLERDEDRPEHDHQQQERHRHDGGDEQRQAAGDAVGQVGDHGPAGERHRGVGAVDRGRQHVGAQVADELVGALVLGGRGRVGGEHRGVAGGVEDRRGHGGDARVGPQRVVDPVTTAWPPRGSGARRRPGSGR